MPQILMTDNDIKQIKKMLVALVNGQGAMKQELLNKIDGIDVNLSNRIDKLEETLTARIDKLGYGLAELADDTPTLEDFDDIDKRLKKVEKTIFKN